MYRDLRNSYPNSHSSWKNESILPMEILDSRFHGNDKIKIMDSRFHGNDKMVIFTQ